MSNKAAMVAAFIYLPALDNGKILTYHWHTQWGQVSGTICAGYSYITKKRNLQDP
ncbi:MAG: hypothetical protein ABSC53_12155 [Bacteroidota bacterium]